MPLRADSANWTAKLAAGRQPSGEREEGLIVGGTKKIGFAGHPPAKPSFRASVSTREAPVHSSSWRANTAEALPTPPVGKSPRGDFSAASLVLLSIE